MADTTYIVLRQARSAEEPEHKEKGWLVVEENVIAANASEAVKIAVQSLNPADGAYVATPMRSWRPLTVTATTQTVLKIT